MATMRDRRSRLVRIVPDRNHSAVLNSSAHSSSTMIDTKIDNRDAADLAGVVEQAVCTVRGSVDDAEKFKPSFVDPMFPIRPVSYATLKRTFDVAFSAVFLLLAWPILLLLAIGVRLSSRGPVMFKQVRVGRGGRYFHCYKFRSMCVDAEAKKETLMHLNEASGPVFKIKQDPRITRFGHFMRKFSLDELPQFVNVLVGDMSIVGPRPPIPAEVDMYTDRERQRLAVSPGLTCLWQVNGRCNLSFERWVELDLEYIDRMTFGLDLVIVLKTIPAVFTGAGAH